MNIVTKSFAAVFLPLTVVCLLAGAAAASAGPTGGVYAGDSVYVQAQVQSALELRIVKLRFLDGCSLTHPQVVYLTQRLRQMEEQQAPRLAYRIHRRVAHQLREQQIALEVAAASSSMSEHNPNMMILRKEISYLRQRSRELSTD